MRKRLRERLEKRRARRALEKAQLLEWWANRVAKQLPQVAAAFGHLAESSKQTAVAMQRFFDAFEAARKKDACQD